MSFSKAKLHRFNEEMTCAPPPGKYDPKFDSKVKGAVIEKSKRFLEAKIEQAPSISSLDSASSCSHSQPTFRTPQLPKKKIFTTPRSTLESSRNILFRTPSSESKIKKKLDEEFKYATEKNLIEQINELIRVHSAQLIDKDQELSTLYNENAELKTNLNKNENSQEIELNNMKTKYEKEISKMAEELNVAQSDLNREKESHEKTIQDFKNQIEVLNENLRNSSALNSELEFQMAESQLSFIEIKNKYFLVKDELKTVKQTVQKMVEEHEIELKFLKGRFAEEIEQWATTSELNIENLTRTMEEKTDRLQQDLDRLRAEDQGYFLGKLEELSAQVQEKIRIFDSRAAEAFDAVQSMAIEIELKSKEFIQFVNDSYKINCDKLMEYAETSEQLEEQKVSNLEQKILIVDLQDKIDILQEEVNRIKKQCRKYEIVQHEATKTIQVLSKRLFESESEVENMNETLEELILRKNALEERIKAINNENNQLKEKIGNLEMSIIKDVMEVERNLLCKVEGFQKSAAEEAQRLNNLLDDKQKTVERMLGEIDFYKNTAKELNEHKVFYENLISDYKDAIQQLSIKFNDIEIRYNNSVITQNNIEKELSEEFEQFKLSSKGKEDEMIEKIKSLQKAKVKVEKECQDKEIDVNEMKTELDIVKEQLIKTEKDLKEMEEKGYEHEKHIEDLAMQLEHYTNCGLKSMQQINSYMKEIEEKNEELKTCREEVNEKKLNVESLNAELLKTETSLQSMTELVVTLMSENANNERVVTDLKHEVEIKQITMVQVSEEYEHMKKMFLDEVKKCEEVENEMQEIQRDNEKYVDELISELVLEKERCSELTGIVEKLTSSQNSNTIKIKAMEEKESELQNKIELAENREKDLSVKISKLEQEFEKQKESYNVLAQENSDIETKLTNEKETCRSFKEQINTLEEKLGSSDNVQELQQRNVYLESNIISLNDELFRVNNTNNSLEKKLVEKESVCKELEEINLSQTTKLNDVTIEKDDLVEIVKRQWEEMELLTNEISSQQEQIDDLKQFKVDKFEELQALHQSELQSEIFALQQNLEDTQKALNELKVNEDDLVFKLKSAEVVLDKAESDKEKYETDATALHGKITELETQLGNMEKRKNEYKIYAVELEHEKIKLKEEINILIETKEKLDEENHEESMKLTSLNARIADLECRNKELESIIGPFKEQLVQFESERSSLLSKTENTEKELKALALEHAKALGHQNHKQKIKHVVHLTETISDLKKEMEKLRNENNKMRSVILEHHKESVLKKTGSIRGKKKENKENTLETSPFKQKNERQSSPANPLKHRNIQ